MNQPLNAANMRCYCIEESASDAEKSQAFEDYSFAVVDQLFTEYGGKLEAMPENLQEVVLIWRMEADMYNGGFLQFFCNWGYDNYVATINLLTRIKAVNVLAILQECEAMISVMKDDLRLENYHDIYRYLDEYLSESQLERLEVLDALYWEDPDQMQRKGYQEYLAWDDH